MATIHGTIFDDNGREVFALIGIHQNLGGLAGTDEDDHIYGYEGKDDLFGGLGDDWLDGGSGIDTMAGGQGNDIYIVDNASDSVSEWDQEGYDTVKSYVSYELPDESIEALHLYNDARAISAVGNGLDNIIRGNSFDNLLYGGEGDDTLYGNNGHDKVWGYTGADTLYGGDGNDWLYGETDDDVLYGDAGNDILDGGSGADIMRGGLNDDTYVVGGGDQVIEYSGEGRDTVYSMLRSYTLPSNVEDLLLDRSWSFDGIGNALDNQIVGNARDNYLSGLDGSDTLYGMEGDDTLIGGSGGTDHLHGNIGNDTYIVRDEFDVVHEEENEGIDTVTATVSYTLGVNVENLNLAIGSFGTGNGLVNTLTGNAGSNTLDGRGGADTMIGLGGNDVYLVDNAGDRVIEAAGEGSDTVRTSVSYTLAADQSVEILEAVGSNSVNLTGNSLANTVRGNAEDNLINGGYGNDTLFGGGGQDYFLFDTAIKLSPNVDTIQDFDIARDSIYLENSVFSTLATPGNLARELTSSEFFTGSAAHDADDRIIYNSQTGALLYDADGNGAGSAVQFAAVTAGLALNSADFLVL